METLQIYENNFNQIQTSFLNYKLELSAFSAVISLNKSLIIDKSGNIIHSQFYEPNHLQLGQTESQRLLDQNIRFQKQVDSLKIDYKNAADKCEVFMR